MSVDVCGYRPLQRSNAGKRAASNSAMRYLGEEAFDGVQPRRAGRREMNRISRMFCKPCFHHRMFMRRVVVHDEMNIEVLGNRTIDVVQELDESFVPMTRQAPLDNFTSERIEGGEQRGRTLRR